jgi:hypothetical protein
VNPNVTCNGSLASYYTPLFTFRVSSAPNFFCICSSLSKTRKQQKAILSSSGVNLDMRSWVHITDYVR